MRYDRGGSFPFDFEPNGISYGSKSKETCHHDHIPFNFVYHTRKNDSYLLISM